MMAAALAVADGVAGVDAEGAVAMGMMVSPFLCLHASKWL